MLKERNRFSESEIVSNLEYLIQTGWVIREEEKFQINKTGKKIPVKSIYYKITDKGFSDFEGPSKFQRVHDSLNGVNFTNIQGVMIIGNSNTVIYSNYKELYNSLDILANAISMCDSITDEAKLEYIAEINTTKANLQRKIQTKE